MQVNLHLLYRHSPAYVIGSQEIVYPLPLHFFVCFTLIA